MKKYILLLVFVAISCSQEPDYNFTPEGNKFLEALDGKNYNGVGTDASAYNFKAIKTSFQTFHNTTPPGDYTTSALFFVKAKNNSDLEGVYYENIPSEGASSRRYRVIKRNPASAILHRTALRTTEAEAINDATFTHFATIK